MDDLIKEFRKFTGFMVPESVKSPVNNAINYLVSKDFALPIDSLSSPVMVGLLAVMENKKTSKMSQNIVVIVCNGIIHDFFIGDAVSSLFRRIEHAVFCFDSDKIMKVIQFSTSVVSKHYLDPPVLQSLLSITVGLCCSSDLLVSTSALAASDQIIKGFLHHIKSSEFQITPSNRRDIDLSVSMYGDQSKKLTEPLEKLLFLMFRDLYKLSMNEQCSWLRVKSIPKEISFGLLETISQVNSMGILLDDCLQSAMQNIAPIQFYCSLFDSFLEQYPKSFTNVFKHFISRLNPRSPDSLNSLVFFRVILMKQPANVTRFFSNCDRDGTLLSSIVSNLLEYCDSFIGTGTFDISLSNKSQSHLSTHSQISSPVEIAIFIVKDCFQAHTSSLRIFISKSWIDLSRILNLASKYVSQDCLHFVIQGLHCLLMLGYELLLDDCRGSIIASFCTFMNSESFEIRNQSYNTIISVIDTNPNVFNGFWGKILPILAQLQWKPNNAVFSKNIGKDQILEFSYSLLSINVAEYSSWGLDILVKVLISNLSRFEFIWEAVEGYLLLMIDDPISESFAISALGNLFYNVFSEETESDLLETFNRLFSGRRKLSTENRKILLEEIKYVLSRNGAVIKKGWVHLINALSPNNFKDEADILFLSFRCVQIICSDLLFLTDLSTQFLCVSLFFEFATQTTDINISLSAFELLWSVVSVAKTTEMWNLIFGRISLLIRDSRNDVSLTAIKTLFSLIMSNHSSIPKGIYDFIVSDCFMPIIDSLHLSDGVTQQLVLHELSHCGRALYSEFLSNKDFINVFWFRLIEENESFYKKCDKKETTHASLQFFEECFLCLELSDNTKTSLFNSVERIIQFSVKRENANSGIWSAFGRLILMVLPQQKSIITEYWLSRWIKIIETFIFDLDCGSFLPPTAHKTLDALDSILPLPYNMTEMIYKCLVHCAVDGNNIRLTEVAIDHICTICEKFVEKEQLSSLFILSNRLFSYKEARRLLLNFVENDIIIADQMIDDVFRSLISLGQSNPELMEKTGLSILKMFTRVSEDQITEFIKVHSNNISIMKSLWSKYLDPTSICYDSRIASFSTIMTINSISNFMTNGGNDIELLEILDFIQNYKTNAECFPNNKSRHFSHLLYMLPYIADLVLHPSISIRQKIRDTLIKLSQYDL